MREILKNLNVLYAEDDPEVRAGVEKTLRLLCGKLYVAEDGVGALELFHRYEIHIIITDYVMPLMDGCTLVQEVRKTDEELPVIILSAHSEQDKLLKVIDQNLTDYLIKPATYETLTRVLQKAVERMERYGRLKIPLGPSLVYDRVQKALTGDHIQTPCRLTRQESELMEILLKRRGNLVEKSAIQERIFGDEPVEPNTLRNAVYRLHKKVGEERIVTVKEIGYVLRNE